MPNLKTAKSGRSIKVYFSTVNRAAPIEKGGEFLLLDWKTKTIEAKDCLYPTNPGIVDPNPRGNARGGRGIEVIGDEVVVATYHTLKIYDRKLHHKRDISHPLMAALHEICADGKNKIAVSSTALDAVLVIDLGSEKLVREYWPREMPNLQRRLGLTPKQIDKQADNRTKFLIPGLSKNLSPLHLNAVAVRQGEMYALFNSLGVIVNLDRDEVIIQDKALRHGHSLLFLEDGTVMVNDTLRRNVHTYNLQTGALKNVINLTDFNRVKSLVYKHQIGYLAKGLLKKLFFRQLSVPRPVFVRGLDRLDNLLFVGISPASILCIDLTSGKLVDSFSYSSNVSACIHGLRVYAE